MGGAKGYAYFATFFKKCISHYYALQIIKIYSFEIYLFRGYPSAGIANLFEIARTKINNKDES